MTRDYGYHLSVMQNVEVTSAKLIYMGFYRSPSFRDRVKVIWESSLIFFFYTIQLFNKIFISVIKLEEWECIVFLIMFFSFHPHLASYEYIFRFFVPTQLSVLSSNAN